jgi:hypothetical protein
MFEERELKLKGEGVQLEAMEKANAQRLLGASRSPRPSLDPISSYPQLVRMFKEIRKSRLGFVTPQLTFRSRATSLNMAKTRSTTGGSYLSHEERTAAEPRDPNLHPVILSSIEPINERIRLLKLTIKDQQRGIQVCISSNTSCPLQLLIVGSFSLDNGSTSTSPA